MDQHEEYHKSPEWFNLWLIYCKKYQPNNPDAKLEPFEITEPSKYKPSPENCIPMTPRVSEWDLTWDERDNAAKKSVEDKGQLISEWLLDVFIWTKIFSYFRPTSLKYLGQKKAFFFLNDLFLYLAIHTALCFILLELIKMAWKFLQNHMFKVKMV